MNNSSLIEKSINPNSSSKCSVITTRIASIFNVCRENEQIQTKRSMKPQCNHKSSDFDLRLMACESDAAKVAELRQEKADFEKKIIEMCT